MFKEETDKSQMDFIESLSSTQFDEIRKFIEGIPQVSYDASYECIECKHNNEVMLAMTLRRVVRRSACVVAASSSTARRMVHTVVRDA